MAVPTRTPHLALAAITANTSRVDLMRIIWTLSWPAIMTFGLESLVGLIDALMVGRLGADAVAGVGVGTQILHAVSVMNMALATGTVALVARHVGANQRPQAEAAVVQSIYLGLGLGIGVALPVIVWAPQCVAVFADDPEVVRAGTDFIRTIMLGTPGMAVFAVVAAGLRGAGDMRTPLLIGAVLNLLNVVVAYVLIFGKLGLPALGVRGAAIASAAAFWTGAVLGVLALLRRDGALTLRRGDLAPHPAIARRVLAVGTPTAVEQLLMQIGFLLYLAIAAGYGTSAVAAYFIGVRILALSFLPGFGFSAASSTIVGQQLGSGQPDNAERSGWEANRLAVVLMSIAGVVIFLFARPIAGLFIDDAAVIDDAVSFIQILALAQPLMAADSTLGGALRGAGDTRFPLLTVIVGFYGARLGFAWFVAHALDLGLAWVWGALLGDYLLRAVLKAWRFHSGRWKRVRV